jgi:hypothetical protein
MALYKVTIHEHKIYDSFIEAPNEALAEEAAEEQIIAEETSKWREDYHAGWTEVGDIEIVEDEDDINAQLV